jgi:hypothetical protein
MARNQNQNGVCTENCVPSDWLKKYACLKCLSVTELKAVIVLALADYLELEVSEILECSACWTCLSKSQKLQAITAVLGDTFLSDQTVDEIREKIKCLLCANPDQIDSALAYGVCALFEGLPT